MMKKYLFATALVFSTSVFAQKELKNLPMGNRIDWYRPDVIKSQRFLIQLVSPLNYGNGKARNLDLKSYNLASMASRNELAADIKKLLEIYKIEKDEDDKGAESQATKDFPIAKDVKNGLKYLNDLNDMLSESFLKKQTDPELVEKMYELSESINMNYKDIIFPKVQLGKLISVIFGLYNSRVGEHPIAYDKTVQGRLDPRDSAFWQKPASVKDVDTYIGFDRQELPNYSSTVFEYKKAKTGFGTHAGFRVELGEQEYKIRLGQESRVAPFSTRILHALGFNSLPIDYITELRVKYDKKIFREFNNRTPLPFTLAIGKVDLINYKQNMFIDPFKYVLRVVLKNGSTLSAEEIKMQLINSKKKKATQLDVSYNSEIEDQIEEVVFKDASIEKIDEANMSIGPWSWDEPRHIERKDIRGYGLLAAWLGQYDARTENTRLMLMEDAKGNRVLRLFVTDVGSGLGKANPLFAVLPDNLEKFRETVVIASEKNNGQMISQKFQTFTTNKCFEATNEQDAEWMFKYIDQLTEAQIKQALRVSNFNEAETNEAYRKLMVRKENIRQVLNDGR